MDVPGKLYLFLMAFEQEALLPHSILDQIVQEKYDTVMMIKKWRNTCPV